MFRRITGEGVVVGWWVAEPYSPGNEVWVWKHAANRAQNGIRQVGGRLFLSEQRLLFQPNRFDAVTRGERWAVSRDQVAEVSVSARQPGLNAAGFRNRLRVSQLDGEVDVFVVNHLDDVLARLRAWLAPDPKP
jgi:hypothetical protein